MTSRPDRRSSASVISAGCRAYLPLTQSINDPTFSRHIKEIILDANHLTDHYPFKTS